MSRTRLLSIAASTLALLAAAALGLGDAPISVGAQASAPAHEARASVPKGVEVRDLDRAADPCTDFDAFSNGSWRAQNPIPTGRQLWSRRTAGREANRRQLRDLLENLAADADRPRGTIEQQLGDHFASCMNEPKVEALGVTPLAPLLADIASVEDTRGVERMIRRLHDLAVPAPFAVTGVSDYGDPESIVVNIAAGGLGLPGRDYYLKTDKNSVEVRAKYREHIARVLTLAGLAGATSANVGEEIVALETRLAEASLSPAAAADPATTAHKMTFTGLRQLSAHFDWESYFAEAHLPRIDVNVAEPAFIERLDRELRTTPVATWKAYLTWHLLRSASPWLSKPFADEAFGFAGQYLGGVPAAMPRAMSCLESTEALLGEPLGHKYAERYFPPAAKARVQKMVQTLLAVLKDDLREVKWISDATRQQALAKVEAYQVSVGYPDVWTDYSSLVIRRDAFWDNVVAARRFGVIAERKRVGHRVSRSIWQLPPSSPGAYIDIQLNLMALPAGFLQAPAFDLAASDAVNYGAIGAGIAHDLTHSIDALGREFDSLGQARNWWATSDLDVFLKIGRCTVDQYDAYEVEPGVRLQGKQVQGEALGDLAGVHLAYRALKRTMQHHEAPVIDGFTPEQQFFISWGQFRGATESLELQRQMVKTDSHPTARYRVIGPLSNSQEFHQAFACKAGSAMVRSPAQRCLPWLAQ